ncbi:MAG: hypothetical protein LBC45_02955 [Chlamydiales bacterium]|nr:hypothetical protein [Chlamydiales bacterium]
MEVSNAKHLVNDLDNQLSKIDNGRIGSLNSRAYTQLCENSVTNDCILTHALANSVINSCNTEGWSRGIDVWKLKF